MKSKIEGIYCPHMVPFDETGAINENELRRLIDYLIEKGINGLYPNGSTGEFVRLTDVERRRVIEIVAERTKLAGRDVPILAGATECNLEATVDTLNYYADLGCTAGALVPPIYFPMTQESVRAYFEEVADKSRLDIMLYHIPQFTTGIDVDTVVSLCEHPRIIGIKDSARDLPRYVISMHKVRKLRPDFVFLIGCEEILLPSLIMGGNGGTIATSGVVPEMLVNFWDHYKAGRIEEAKAIQYQMLDLIEAMLAYGADFPEGFRAGMTVRGFNMGRGRHHRGAASKLNLENITRMVQCLIAEHGIVPPPAEGCPPRGVDEGTIREIVTRVMQQLGG